MDPFCWVASAYYSAFITYSSTQNIYMSCQPFSINDPLLSFIDWHMIWLASGPLQVETIVFTGRLGPRNCQLNDVFGCVSCCSDLVSVLWFGMPFLPLCTCAFDWDVVFAIGISTQHTVLSSICIHLSFLYARLHFTRHFSFLAHSELLSTRHQDQINLAIKMWLDFRQVACSLTRCHRMAPWHDRWAIVGPSVAHKFANAISTTQFGLFVAVPLATSSLNDQCFLNFEWPSVWSFGH